jgi:16S rRNA (adenine1518-N6/adenine1519-N6)-dimethyltransferase
MPSPLSVQTRRLIDRFGLRAKKSLGQHFLIDGRALQRVVSAADLTSGDTVIEVGPGLGILTRELARRARKVIAVEADSGLARALREMVGETDNVTIVESDILQVEPALLLASASADGGFPAYKVVANIPYYITSPILRHFLEASPKPSDLVVTVQKEVGEAIAAQPGKMSLLAVSVQFYGKPAIVGRVPARSFYPAPKVDSVILRIKLHEHPPIMVSEPGAFFAVVRAGFSAPRKQLRNSLALGLGIVPRDAATLLEKVMIDPQRRAQTLSLEEWAKVFEEVGGGEARTGG